MFSSLSNSIVSCGFPAWRTLNQNGQTSKSNFTLTMSNNYRDQEDDIYPHSSFDESAETINLLRSKIVDPEKYAKFMVDAIGHAIYASNMQEKAGLGLEDTMNMCLEIFQGAEVSPEVDISSRYFSQASDFLIANSRSHGREDVIKARREVIQHAKALEFLIDWALHSNEELSEQLLLDTHKILCEYIPSQNGNLEYAGTYRTVAAMAGSTLFTAAENVPREMRIFIDDFNNDVKSREISKEMDPFFLAADICQDFVTIHPFLDGNGRMCRLIANAYLIRYAGIVISIGEDEADRREYLSIAAYAGDGETEENARGMLAHFFLKKGTRALGELKEFLGREEVPGPPKVLTEEQ